MISKDFMSELKSCGEYCEFYNTNKEILKQKDYVATWQRALKDLKIKKADVIAKAEIGYTYFYDILRGDKHPTRDILIKLFLATELDLDSCQEILYTYDWAYLYPDVTRDSIIIYAILNRLNLAQANALLREHNQNTL